jgi:hypothetical protein
VAHAEQQVTDGVHPFSTWAKGEIVRDIHSLWLDTNIPAGDYAVEVAILSVNNNPVEWITVATLHREFPAP